MRIPLALVLGVMLIPALGLAGVGVAQAQFVQVDVQAAPVPIWGIVLGTVIVAGLLYLVVHGPDGGYYRYPYYGEYYQHYYHPEYRPYTGFYPASALVVTVAPVIVGTVLGIVVIDNHQYVLSRDAGGHLYRYPYYGPYRQVYYRPAYHPYEGVYVKNGAYRSAPVRQGDQHWDGDKRNLAPASQRPQPHSAHQQPGRQQPPHPTYQQPHALPNRGQNGGRDNSGGSRDSQQRCGHSQPCPDNNEHR
jgi:hypothetical protein